MNPTGKEIWDSFTDPFDYDDLSRADAFVMLGKAGAGKTTLLNAMVNNYWGAEFDQKQRWKIIGDEAKILTNINAGSSVTFRVSTYFIMPIEKNSGKKPLIIIDTPGFGDAMGRDTELSKALQDFLR